MMAILSSRVIINVRRAARTAGGGLTTISADPLHFAINPNGTQSSSGWRPEVHSRGASVETAHRSVHRHVDADGIDEL